MIRRFPVVTSALVAAAIFSTAGCDSRLPDSVPPALERAVNESRLQMTLPGPAELNAGRLRENSVRIRFLLEEGFATLKELPPGNAAPVDLGPDFKVNLSSRYTLLYTPAVDSLPFATRNAGDALVFDVGKAHFVEIISWGERNLPTPPPIEPDTAIATDDSAQDTDVATGGSNTAVQSTPAAADRPDEIADGRAYSVQFTYTLREPNAALGFQIPHRRGRGTARMVLEAGGEPRVSEIQWDEIYKDRLIQKRLPKEARQATAKSGS